MLSAVFGNSQTALIRQWHGTYILLFPGLIYAFMASSPHNSVGGMSIVVATLSVSFMQIQDAYYPNEMRDGRKMTAAEQFDLHLSMGPGIALVAGCFQVVLGMFKLGFLSAILSPNVIQPFSIACFLQSICSKILTSFGLPRLIHFGYAKHFRDIIYFLKNLDNINGYAVLLSLSMASIVLCFREFLQPRLYTAYRVVVPIEFILFVIYCGLSYCFDFEKRYNISVVGNYSYGFLQPAVPDFTYGWDMLFAGIVMAIVSYTVTLESANVLAQKNGDQISPNQELLALGSAHIFGSFFTCIPVAASVGRGQVNQAIGSHSQISTLVACLFAFFLVEFAGPGIAYLPTCIISVNMILFLSMSMGAFLDVPRLWRNNKMDACIWMITFIVCISTTVQMGLFIGSGLSIISLLVRSQRPKVRVMGILRNTNWGFVALKHYETARELPGIRVLQIQSPMSYANSEFLVKQVTNLAWEEYAAAAEFPVISEPKEETPLRRHASLNFLTGRQNPAIRALVASNILGSLDSAVGTSASLLRQRAAEKSGLSASMSDLSQRSASDGTNLSEETEMSTATRIILDLGGVGYIDSVGIRALEQIASDLKRLGIETILAQCTGQILKQLKRLEIHKIIPEANIFPSVVDAVEEAIRRIRSHKEPSGEGEVVGEYEDDRFWDVPVVPVEGLPVVDLDKVRFTDD
ncbi:prestin-like isoform X2 [Paramacrobiotus metropolitanus]|uniref:prestin-like isoform X2 n=1 Tax=Paramacrobiotus metropolitanus TaxID=2943436 RepID=UPI0024462C67|nr:prestin-like isoform X2 [Paramacrobiotus metropolitanus]XP_055342390.1 prestin-like isoform X2 [Paramacrobiotus metropolitanus]